MPPRASSRIDVLVLPAGEVAGVPARVVASHLDMVWLPHDEAQPRFLGNERGGFRVNCPRTGEPAARPFSRGLQSWREGGPRAVTCRCEETHDLSAFLTAPPAGIASSWLQLPDAPSTTLDEATAHKIAAFWPDYRVLLVRP